MESKNNNNSLIIILMGVIILILVVLCVLFATGTLTFTNVEKEKNDVVESQNKEISLNVDDYVYIEQEKFDHSEFDVKKVNFKNIDNKLVEQFLEKQKKLIEQAHSLEGNYDNEIFGPTYAKTSNLIYQINDKILSVYYEIKTRTSPDYDGCITSISLNIDLENNKVLNNDEVLKLAGYSLESIAEEEYNKRLELLKSHNDSFIESKEGKHVYYEEFSNNKNYYLDLIKKGAESVVNTYIEDTIVKYDYVEENLYLTYANSAKDGCYPHKTITVGKIK